MHQIILYTLLYNIILNRPSSQIIITLSNIGHNNEREREGKMLQKRNKIKTEREREGEKVIYICNNFKATIIIIIIILCSL